MRTKHRITFLVGILCCLGAMAQNSFFESLGESIKEGVKEGVRKALEEELGTDDDATEEEAPGTQKVDVPPEILLTGEFHGDEIFVDGGDHWWGVFKTKTGYEFRQTTVTITAVEDPIVDAPGEKTGKKVDTSSNDECVFLIQNLYQPKAGTVPTIAVDMDFLYPGEYKFLGGMKDDDPIKTPRMLAAFGTGKLGELGMVVTDYKLSLFDTLYRETKKEQVLVEFPQVGNDHQPNVLWAGDVDRDGKADLLVDFGTDYNTSNIILYLSTFAYKPDGELVGQAASLMLTGC